MLERKRIMNASIYIMLLTIALISFTTGLLSVFDEGSRMVCVSDAIYHDITENEFVQCLLKSGVYNSYDVILYFVIGTLTIASLSISIISANKK